MKQISCFIIVCVALKASASTEQFDESAWMDHAGSDKYFEYSDLTQPVIVKNKNRVDVVQFKTRPQPQRRRIQSSSQSSNIIELFFNAISNVPKGNAIKHSENETSKGIDFRFQTSNSHIPPTFGNSQDLKLVYIGTKWCGAGDVAKNKRDIGYFYMTDTCCRNHDLCDRIIDAQESKFGLKNSGKFTRLHCDCDNEFYRCLKNVNSLVSKQIGIIFFNVLGAQCFKEEYPYKCTQNSRGRCIKYTIDTSQPKRYQWFDNKWF